MGYRHLRTRVRNNPAPKRSSKKPVGLEKPGTHTSQNPPHFSGREVTSLGGISLTSESIWYLRRTIGNRALNRLIQAKLKISQPGDEYEREADRVADNVLRSPEPETIGLSRIQQVTSERREESPLQRMPEEKRQAFEEEEQTIHAKEQPGTAPAASSENDSQIEVLPDRGKPLPEAVRAYFEPRFGLDFSEVRVHEGAQAAESAQAINARAYTTGEDIVFGSGEYAPGTTEGKRLLAHELTHVVQQGKARRNKLAHNSHNTIHQTSTRQVSRQGFLTPAQETAAIDFNNARYDERSIRIFQIITGAAVDGQFGRLSAEAVAGFQNANGLGIDGQVGENTLNAMVPNRAAAGLHEHAIQLVVDFYNLNVTRDTLTVHFDPALAVAGATTLQPGNLRVIRIGPPAFASAPVLRNAINAQLASPAPAPAAVGPRPAHLTNARELEAVQFNQGRFGDRRSVLAIQALVGARPDGVFGSDTVERIAEFQNVNVLAIDGKAGDVETLPAMVAQLIAANNQDSAIRMIVDFYNFRDDGNLLDVFFDPGVAANADTDFRPDEPVRVRVGPSGLAQPFPGIVHTIAHEYEHVRRLKEGIVGRNTHEFLGEAIEILSEGMREEALETLAPAAPGFVAGFANDANRALVNWNAMSLADRRTFRNRFIAVRQRVRDRIAAGTPAQQALHAALLAGYNAVVLPPP
jgi:peptidoglycan hydrolase-like protein with peptidoglycan-binding domain